MFKSSLNTDPAVIARLLNKPTSDGRMSFFNVSKRHELTPAQQNEVKRLCRRDMTIGEMRTGRLYYDWWASGRPRFRLQGPARLRIARMRQAMVRASFDMRPRS